MKTGFTRKLTVVYGILLTGFILFIAFATDVPGSRNSYLKVHSIDMIDSWTDEKDRRVSLDAIPLLENRLDQTLYSTVPKGIRMGESLNLCSRNLRFRLYLNKELIYNYMPVENITGLGTGTVYHSIPLPYGGVGSELMLIIYRPFEGETGGSFVTAKLCNSRDFDHMMIHENALAISLSALIIFFGVVIVIVHFTIFKENHLGYDLLSLGISTIILGTWTFVESDIVQMLMGSVIAIRFIDYILLSLSEFPIVCFIVSVTRKKRSFYKYLSFGIMVLCLGTVLLLRKFAGIDMHKTMGVLFLGYIVTTALVAIILIDNWKYCKSRGIKANLTYFSIGAMIFTVGAALDMGRYIISGKTATNNGSFVRIGLVLFIISMFMQIIKWITQVQKKSSKEEFVNSLMQSSMSGRSAEETIQQMVEYLGSELKADKAYLYELQDDGRYIVTYEWFSDAGDASKRGLTELPYEGVIDAFMLEYEKTGSVIVDDLRRYKEPYPVLYNTLTRNGIHGLICAPVIISDKIVGFFGVNNPPEEKLDEIADIIQYLKYFFSEAIERRGTEEKLISYSYYDQMTGVGNRRAIGEFETEKLDTTKPYGFVMCDINGLKRVNDNEGHEAGDAMIKDVADAMRDAFGKQFSFRMGGDEFAAYKVCNEEVEFMAAVETLRDGIAERGRSASIGYIYVNDPNAELNEIKKKADMMMYEDKSRYYQGRTDRRRK
ncbi:MAG: diguanylate cyclase [Lachnospiraceae bacterium]|nr:diguanylate cyclase [Lachnospiraceae bacterium]